MRSIGITGHQNLPDNSVAFIREEIKKELLTIDDVITGISSLAVGADQLFADIILSSENNLYVVLPCANYEETFNNGIARRKYLHFLQKADTFEMLPFKEPSEEAFLQAGKRVVDLSDVVIAVWDGLKPKGKGGTSDIVSYARGKKKHVIIIWPKGISR